MKLNLIIILLSVLSYSCTPTKQTHFALEEHTFEETCAYFDSCHRASNLELYKNILITETK